MKMDDIELLSLIEQQERLAVGFIGGEIAAEQRKALDYYQRKPFGTEEDGRSQVVSSDVWDVVEGLTPLILRPFVATDDVVKFSAVGPEDEEAAQQESDYINHIVTQRNDVFNQLVSAVKTGLLQKNGVAKYWWETSRQVDIERYFGIEDDVYALMLQDLDAAGGQVVQHTETQGPFGPVHDVVIRVPHEKGCAKYAVVPPEEFRISRDATSPNPKSARFVEHIRKLTISDIRAMGYDVEDDVQDYNGSDPLMSEQYISRRNAEETELTGSVDMDPTLREVTFREIYCLVDYDGDGIAELRKLCLIGREILCNEETEEIPFVAWTPYPQPFKFYGSCPADETTDIQLIKSALWRQNLDNLYTINNNRNFVSTKVNIDDLLDNQIAGVIRVDADSVVGHVQPAPVQPIGAIVQGQIEYLDSAKENRTGFTRYNQGTDANSLNKTATGVRIIAEAGNQRVELVARAFAEQFLKPLMIGIHGLIRRHASEQDIVRLRGKWVTVDPRQWKRRTDMTVSVGLGTADKQMQLQGIQMLMAEQKQLVQAGLVMPPNLYNSAAKLAELLGEKSPERYFTDPQTQQPAPPPDPMQSPEAQFKMAELDLKKQEIALKERDQDLKERQAQVDALLREAETKLKAATAMLSDPLLMASIQREFALADQITAAAQSEVIEDTKEPENEPGEPQEMEPQAMTDAQLMQSLGVLQ